MRRRVTGSSPSPSAGRRAVAPDRAVRPRRGAASSPAPRPAGRREQKKSATRARLLRAGRALFGERGLYEPRIEDLAARAGIAKGTLYLYFPSKEAIVAAVVEHGFADLGRRTEAAAGRTRGAAARAGAIARAHLGFYARNPDLMRVFHQVRGVLKFGRAEWRPLARPVAAHLARIERLLGGRGPAARFRAELLFGAVSGVCSVRASLGAALDDRRWSQGVAAAMVAAVAGRPPHTRNPGGR